jgi:AcrR family transcriptional regulator
LDDERGKIVSAIGKAVAEYGYRDLSLEQILGYAEVSEAKFNAEFENLGQGLIAAQAEFLERLRLEVTSACEDERNWAENVRAALAALLAYVADANAMARGLTVEATAASLAASERQFAALDGFADLLREGRRFYPNAAAMPSSAERALIGGVASIISQRLLAEEPQALTELEPQLTEFLLLPYVGQEGASRTRRN